VSADPPACVEYHHLAVVDKVVWFVGRRPVPAMQDDAVAIRWRPHHSHRSTLQQMLRAPALQCQSSYYHCQRTMLLHVEMLADSQFAKSPWGDIAYAMVCSSHVEVRRSNAHTSPCTCCLSAPPTSAIVPLHISH